MHARPLELGHRHPVGHAGRRFHEHEGLAAFEAAVDVVEEGDVGRQIPVVLLAVPHGVGVPRDDVQVRGHAPVVETGERAHEVGRDGHVRRDLAQRDHLVEHEVGGLVGDETFPIQVVAVDAGLADLAGRLDLAPVGVGVAPERGPPGLVEVVQRSVAGAQPLGEGGPAMVAVTLAAVLVGKVPEQQRRVILVALGQQRVDDERLLAIDRRAEAVVVAATVQIAPAVRPHAQHFRILGRHPGRARAGRRGQHRVGPVFGQHVHDPVQPAELEAAFLRLKMGPREDADRHGVAVGQLHEAHVLGPDLLGPLVRIVVAAMQHVGELGVDWAVLFDHGWLLVRIGSIACFFATDGHG